MIQLNTTYAPGVYYVAFNKLPAAARKLIDDPKNIDIECSSYTVGENTAFIRCEIELDGDRYEAEIHLGKVEFEDDYNEDGDLIYPDNIDDIYKDRANEMFHCFDWRLMDVYLTAL